jgi:phage terminase large subunit
MRGGEKFWDFRTFNPPISKNNWANEYTEDCEIYRQDNTLVVRNTYLDVPEDWLGQQFIEEAEDLKAINPRAYEHEYLGHAIGTGGDVFQNVEEFDADAPTEIQDIRGKVIKTVKLSDTFDTVYNGIDWGFALDPFHYAKCYFDSRRLDLYIFREYRTIQSRNETVFRELYEDEKLLTPEDLVTADSAEPKSIADFKAYGAFIRGAEKGPDSVRYGIKWLQGLRHIYIDKRKCPNTWREFTTYEYEKDKDGNFISAYPDMDNHSIDAVRYAMEKYYKRRGK